MPFCLPFGATLRRVFSALRQHKHEKRVTCTGGSEVPEEKPVRQRRSLKNSVDKLLTDVLELPKDLVLNLPRVTMVGNIQLTLENHRGVILYTDSRVRVAVEKGEVVVVGQKLTLRSIYADEIIIDGLILDVSFVS